MLVLPHPEQHEAVAGTDVDAAGALDVSEHDATLWSAVQPESKLCSAASEMWVLERESSVRRDAEAAAAPASEKRHSPRARVSSVGGGEERVG
jgi:hypothetical protein